MFYAKIHIITDENVIDLQMKKFNQLVGQMMYEIFKIKIELDVILDIFEKEDKDETMPDMELMDEILENFDLPAGAKAE